MGWFTEMDDGDASFANVDSWAGSFGVETPSSTGAVYYDDAGNIVPGEGTSYTQADVAQYGTPNTLPAVSTAMQSSAAGSTPFAAINNLLGQVVSTVRSVGQAVGAVRQTADNAQVAYREGVQQGTASQTKLGQWWLTSSTNDKILVGLGIAGLYLAFVKK